MSDKQFNEPFFAWIQDAAVRLRALEKIVVPAGIKDEAWQKALQESSSELGVPVDQSLDSYSAVTAFLSRSLKP
jgi:hypothetical protein